MTPIQPNSIITLYKNVEFDTNYKNTTYWSTREAQETFFNDKANSDNITNKLVFILNGQQYTRTTRNEIKVSIPYGECFSVSYMRIQNPSPYENKNFYCFVDSVSYIQDSTSLITFHVDVMQTWLVGIDYNLGSCFVKREHVGRECLDENGAETIGYNIVPEQIELGEQVIQNRLDTFFNDFYICVGVVPTSDMLSALQGWSRFGESYISQYDKMLQNCVLLCYDLNDETEYYDTAQEIALTQRGWLARMLKDYDGKPENIGVIYMLPKSAISESNLSWIGYGNVERPTMIHVLNNESLPAFTDISYIPNTETIDGYTPHNKKLFTYPFQSICALSSDGDMQTYRYEWFGTSDVNRKFRIMFNLTPPVNADCRPLSYRQDGKNKPLADAIASYRTTLNCSVMGGWINDNFHGWLQQNVGKIAIQLGATAITHSIGLGYANDLLQISKALDKPIEEQLEKNYYQNWQQGNLFNTRPRTENYQRHKARVNASAKEETVGIILQALSGSYSASINNASAQGLRSGALSFANEIMGFTFYQLVCNSEYAKRIDMFFDAYGYACNQIKVPNVHARNLWSFVETQDCEISSSTIPCEDKAEIMSVYNSGVRLFNNIEPINGYMARSANNTIIS